MCRYDDAHLARMYYEHWRVKKPETWPSHKLYVFVHKYPKGICEELTNVEQVRTRMVFIIYQE